MSFNMSKLEKNNLPASVQSALKSDFNELLEKGKILKAVNLSQHLTTLLGKPIYFSHFGEPHYPVQNFDAQTFCSPQSWCRFR